MSIELTEEQQQAIEQAKEIPPRVVNPRTRKMYVLLPADTYERMKDLLQEDFDPRDGYPLVDKIMAEDDANDPYLQSYQDYPRKDRQ